ncbi:MAG: Holliday junction ATP-dependent DNA helicase RuvB [Parcubacteria group bacterium GW2011_GWA2_50_10b]|nr:MAG: Holliday junction ATP-dependent DNA helicase RuvB [Parcubacteria group bacterium GW2011_GWA2_50_10b]
MSSQKSKAPKEEKAAEEAGYASFLDKELRPSSWADYIGQQAVKNNLNILIRAATERGVPPEHVLFYGPPGLGKTTLAHLVAKETGRNLKITSGPAIERVGDLASILTNLSAGDILFIDEIHRLNKTIEEVLYPAMESGVLDIIIGKGPSARTIQLELPPFTLLAATTRVAMISSPLRSRFSGGVFRLEFYTEEEIAEILRRSAKIIGVNIEKGAEKEIAKRSRFTPRTANYFLKRARDFAQVESRPFDTETVNLSLKLLGIDEKGLSPADRQLLEVMADKFGGGPVGLGTLAAALSLLTVTNIWVKKCRPISRKNFYKRLLNSSLEISKSRKIPERVPLGISPPCTGIVVRRPS